MTSHRIGHSPIGTGGRAVLITFLTCSAYFASPLAAQTTPWDVNGSTWYAPSGTNVAIGTNSATIPLIAVGSGAGNLVGTTYQVGGYLQDFSQCRGVSLGYDTSGQIGVMASATCGTCSQLAFWTLNGNWGERMRIAANGNVGVGTTNPQHLLHVAGTIGVEEVIVSSTGADYVFEPSYHLSSLQDLDQFIKANHHLPEVPSAAEAREKGMSVGEMETKLLAKIEELTLHMIEANKHNRLLEQQNEQPQKRVTVLEAARALFSQQCKNSLDGTNISV